MNANDIYRLGSRVICLREHASGNDYLHEGMAGTVVELPMIGLNVGVQWDDYVNGHDCSGGNAEYGYGWYVSCDDIAPLPQDNMTEYEYTDADILEFLAV